MRELSFLFLLRQSVAMRLILALFGVLRVPEHSYGFGSKGSFSDVLNQQKTADLVVVLKSERQLILMQDDTVLRIYRIALGRYPKGHKVQEGDARTPEGSYILDKRIEDSAFFKALRISYPNQIDLERSRQMGVNPGGKIMIHGLPNALRVDDIGHPYIDWTQGCIAVTNQEMEEIWGMIELGTPIEIHP